MIYKVLFVREILCLSMIMQKINQGFIICII